MTSTTPQLWDNYYGVLTNLNFLIGETGDPTQANYKDLQYPGSGLFSKPGGFV
jgi:hypothetical protein